MIKVVDRLYDTTSASGAGLDTGTLEVALYDALLVIFQPSGGTPGAGTASVIVDGTAVQIATHTPTTTEVLFNWHPSAAAGDPQIAALVPQQVKFTAAAIVAQTVRLIIYGMRRNA